jgi:SagB-type dehydrogenase family enzyme
VTSTPPLQTVGYAGWVYGSGPAAGDAAEDLHEASRLYPEVVDAEVTGGSLLQRSPDLRASARRSVLRRTGLPTIELPRPAPLSAALADTLRARRSTRVYGGEPISLEELSSLVRAAYGVTGRIDEQQLRSVPSGGALYPLELYVAATNVHGLEVALYHFDPLRGVLERLRALQRDELAGLTPYDELVVPSAAVTLISAVFWRSRFKYGARAYRFALLEAGHVAQNYVLAATALRLSCCPVGGFFDRRVDTLLGVDGLYEASLYLLPVGRRAP